MTPQRSFPAAAQRVRRAVVIGAAAAGLGGLMAACTPTVRLEVAPIQITARLDADVRVRLDKELSDLLQQNPNLF